jgi:hypothetical protein
MTGKRYCTTCGAPMMKKIVPLKTFDPFTGKRDIDIKLRCPNARWYRYGHWGDTITSEYEKSEEVY